MSTVKELIHGIDLELGGSKQAKTTQ